MIFADLIIRFSPTFRRTRCAFDKHSILSNWGEYLKIGVPSAFMVCFEWWALEILAIFSGFISVAALASQVIVVNIVTFIFMMPLGISYAASALTGNYIGQGNIKLAKRFANLTVLFNIFLSILLVLLISFNKTKVCELFNDDPAIIDIVADCFWTIQAYILVDGIHGVQSGIIRGLGKQFYASFFTLVSYYLIGLPLSLAFTF